MIRTRRSVPGSTLSELVVNLSPLCVPDTKRDTNKTENCFSLGCFICILMNFSTVDSSFSSIFMASTRTKITFRSLCMYAKTYAGYYSERSSTRIFCPKFVLGHERARERAAILGSLTRCRDFVSVVPEPME